MTTLIFFALSTFFGSGLSPIAPGTCGTIAGLLCSLALQNYIPGIAKLYYWLPLVLLVSILGIFSSKYYLEHSKTTEADPKEIVIDEVAGIMLAISGLSLDRGSSSFIIIAFMAFRFFDMSKIGLIGKAEKLKGAMGIMADDLVAGLYTIIFVQICRIIFLSNGILQSPDQF